jgi:hypothetical protein
MKKITLLLYIFNLNINFTINLTYLITSYPAFSQAWLKAKVMSVNTTKVPPDKQESYVKMNSHKLIITNCNFRPPIKISKNSKLGKQKKVKYNKIKLTRNNNSTCLQIKAIILLMKIPIIKALQIKFAGFLVRQFYWLL